MSVRSEMRTLIKPLFDGRVYADRLDGQPRPAAVIRDDISRAPALIGDGRSQYWRQLEQVDVWQDASTENASLVDDVLDTLDGARIVGRRLRVRLVVRVPDPDANLVHTAITVEITRPR